MLRKIGVSSANRKRPNRYQVTFAIILLFILVFAAWQPVKETFSPEDEVVENIDINSDVESNNNAGIDEQDPTDDDAILTGPTNELASDEVTEYVISNGDTLAKVLEEYGIGFKEVFALTQKYPVLAKDLRPGQVISWTIDDEGHLQNLTWTVNRKETRVYELTEDEGFVETIEMAKGEWREIIITGEIGQDGNTTLCGSANAAGLTSRECHNAIRYLQLQVNLNALRIGDTFTFLLEREFLEDEHITSRLLAAKMHHRKRDRYIVYFDKYRAYYDDEGKPFTEGFLRIPTSSTKEFRISSHFNPRRLHPVTKRVAPHNGVDFAMPTGTPLVAAGDGEIIVARYSPTAGNYVAIKHGTRYTTRYLHMHKLNVRPGQIVKRGDLIGYSGNTGRSTGPHLHYEFLVDNKAVDPMKMTLPRPEGLKGAELKEFLTYVDTVKAKFAENQALVKQEKEKALETQSSETQANADNVNQTLPEGTNTEGSNPESNNMENNNVEHSATVNSTNNSQSSEANPS